MKKIIGISCLASNRAIGIKNNLIFKLPRDMQFFKNTTIKTNVSNKTNAVIMGKNTFNSLRGPCLPKRHNCVISNSIFNGTNVSNTENISYFSNIHTCLNNLNYRDDIESIYVIGGESIYKYFMDNNLYDELLISYVSEPEVDYGDTFFPYINFNIYNKVDQISNENILNGNNLYKYSIYNIKKTVDYNDLNICNNNAFIYAMTENKNEYQYLNLLRKVRDKGTMRQTRNSNTISLFSEKMEFDISESFPLLTTKKVYFKGIAAELLWFINGKTDSKLLEKDKVNIWRGNSSREYLDSIGLNSNREGDCGPIYGFQWRHFNAKYKGPDEDYTGEGIDQLGRIIDLIKNDPMSRRMFMSGWNPCQLDEMALPPCHVSYQFYVRFENDTKYLDCMMYQRSGDLFLGVPFNIASTSMLVYILANICDIKPGKINIVIGDAHIYENHINQIEEQINRVPTHFPRLVINKKLNNLEELNYEDLVLEDYNPQPTIKASMIA